MDLVLWAPTSNLSWRWLIHVIRISPSHTQCRETDFCDAIILPCMTVEYSTTRLFPTRNSTSMFRWLCGVTVAINCFKSIKFLFMNFFGFLKLTLFPFRLGKMTTRVRIFHSHNFTAVVLSSNIEIPRGHKNCYFTLFFYVLWLWTERESK